MVPPRLSTRRTYTWFVFISVIYYIINADQVKSGVPLSHTHLRTDSHKGGQAKSTVFKIKGELHVSVFHRQYLPYLKTFPFVTVHYPSHHQLSIAPRSNPKTLNYKINILFLQNHSSLHASFCNSGKNHLSLVNFVILSLFCDCTNLYSVFQETYNFTDTGYKWESIWWFETFYLYTDYIY